MWFWLLWVSWADAALFDRVLAQVDQQLVLASELAIEAGLAEHDPDALPFWRSGADPAERLVQGAVIRLAAGDIGLYQPSIDDVQARLDRVRGSFVDRAAWEEFLRVSGTDEAGLRTVLRRRLIVERFLKRNVQASLDEPEAWLQSSDVLLAQLVPRVRIRWVPPEGD
jgi:hypothetical protein